MGVCFIGKRHFPSFLSQVKVGDIMRQSCEQSRRLSTHILVAVGTCILQYVEDKPGRFLTLSGEVLGSHNGR